MEANLIKVSKGEKLMIPGEFYDAIGFRGEAECILRNNEIILRPVKRYEPSGEFDVEILADLIAQGLSGEKLLEEFKAAQRKVRPAVEHLLAQAKAAAKSEPDGINIYSYDDVFGKDE